jgi:hypothetical protein
MHLLVHWLNKIGYQAYLHISNGPPSAYETGTNPDLLTPRLTQDIALTHYRMGRTPIVVCSESFSGTLPNAPFTVRWYGHYAGALTPGAVDACEMRFGYSTRLAASIGVPENVLLLPVIDTAMFTHEPRQERRGSCFYASKFQSVFGGKVFGLPPDCIEITRDLPDSQTPAEIAALFRSCAYFYCFEESALVVEAGLCDCPVILMKNEHFNDPFGVDDFGWDGFAWGNDPLEVDRARRTVHKVKDNYRALLHRFFDQLESFVRKTQNGAEQADYVRPILLRGAADSWADGMTPEQLRSLVAELEHQVAMIRRSTSWKVTAPLRAAITACRAIVKPSRDEQPIAAERPSFGLPSVTKAWQEPVTE